MADHQKIERSEYWVHAQELSACLLGSNLKIRRHEIELRQANGRNRLVAHGPLPLG